MSILPDDMRPAIIHAAERELELKLGDKPIDDDQICGTAYDVDVEGKYLGWTNAAGKEEARKLYESTPSRLRPLVWRHIVQPQKMSAQVGLALKDCQRLEAEFLTSHDDNVLGQLGMLRRRLEVLFEMALEGTG